MIDFRGARGSNAGDAFHELWAARQAIRLLHNEDGLEAIAVEGLGSRDEAGKSPDTWDGVDCTLYFGGRDANEADRIEIEQLKYSAANPKQSWTVARLIGGTRRDRSVIGRLAKAWKELAASRFPAPPPRVVLVSNQPVEPKVLSAVCQAAGSPLTIPTCKPVATAAPELLLAWASGLDVGDFQAFASVLDFETGTGSRFALEEQVLQTMTEWTDLDVQGVVTKLREFVRQRMMPESAGELITRESVLLLFGASDEGALFPCPSEIKSTEAPVSRESVQEATTLLRSGVQYLCLHGDAGVGKTTALQELYAALPADSIMVKYDCYGGGRYLDPSALRHRARDAFLQLTNELAAHLKMPLLLNRRQDSDYPRLFASRLKHAADALSSRNPDAMIVIAVDAADNAAYAAQSRNPVEPSFVCDFVQLADQPENVRLIVTARTGRLESLQLPRSYHRREIKPFNRSETGESVARIWPAPQSWIDDFHHFSRGIPRIQAYAFEVNGAHPSTALDRLMPDGKSLEEIFRGRFEDASRKSGNPAEVELICAGLVALPRPVPLSDLAAVLNRTEKQISDVCVDLSPGIRLQNDTIILADEDFEEFVRTEGEGELSGVRKTAAEWLRRRADSDHYAALHVAEALVAAGRGRALLDLVENEPVPHAVRDPVLRREAELRRLRLALEVCREAEDIVRALRFVLIGAEGIKTETALRRLLAENPDLTARFAYETAGRLILSDADHIEDHGSLLFQKLAVDANRGDAISVREGWRFLQAWLDARGRDWRSNEKHYHEPWKISISDISSAVEATFKLDGPPASLSALRRWTPRRVALEVALALPYQLIAEGYGGAIETLASEDHLDPLSSLFLLVPLALAGRPVDSDRMAFGLEQLMRRKLHVKKFFRKYSHGQTLHGQIIDVALTACEICTSKKTGDEIVDKLLTTFLESDLRRIDRHSVHETFKLDVLFRAYALREARENRIPSVEDVFEPRPPSDEKDRRHRGHWEMEPHDRKLKGFSGTVFHVYATVARALVDRWEDSELEDELRGTRSSFEQNEWRITRQFGSGPLRDCAARNLTTLLAAGYKPEVIMSSAFDIDDRWRGGYEIPNRLMIARLSLWPRLHNPLVEILSSASEEARGMRIGAGDKSGILVGFARRMKPLSEKDANEIFNYAIEAASELDHEVMIQIELLDQLVRHSNRCFTDARDTAQSFSNIVVDAAIRLDDDRHFPWDRAMFALARLDAPLALANVARWDDEGIATLREILPAVLMTSLSEQTIKPEQAAALTVLSDDPGDVMAEILKRWDHTGRRNYPALLEEAACDALIRGHRLQRDELIQRSAQTQPHGRWADALLRQKRFLETLSPGLFKNHGMKHHTEAEVECPLNMHVWNRETLIDSSTLQRTAQELSRNHAQGGRTYLPFHTVFESARRAVSPNDRILHLEALAGIEGSLITRGAVDALFESVDEWWISPSIKAWCRESLPNIIVVRFPEFARYLVLREEDRCTCALNRTGLSGVELQKLILSGLERHVDGFNSELVFKIAGTIGCMLDPSDAAGLVDWYVRRLAERIPAENRDQTAPPGAIPRCINETVARFLFAYMGDCDLRLRWRSAHAVRRLARTGEEATLKALIGEYYRREETVFRGRNFSFYWLAARLWFVLTWDRIVVETPDQAKNAACILRRIALDDSFPHLLIRSFARDACEKLIKAGQISLTNAECDLLKSVNESPLPREPEVRKTGTYGHGLYGCLDKDRRFNFDPVDTIPYWYQPMLRSFSDVAIGHFLREVERWIIDVWDYNDDSLDWKREYQRGCFRYDNGSLSNNGHGSKPTLEHLRTHLEWHAMWCAAGELLKTEPLTPSGKDCWDELSDRISWEKLVEPPLWSADLRTSTPLTARNWRPDTQALDDWVSKVDEAIYRVEIFPDDSPEYMVVDGSSERRSSDRSERTSICSALVEPAAARSLLRALQTMSDTWDYKIPDEGEEQAEIDEGPYRFLGWLVHPSRDSGIDDKDPLRAYGLVIHCRPGRRVVDTCNLRRDVAGQPCWSSNHAEQPMFVYETWGEPERDDERYTTRSTVSGHRLLAHKGQLLNFLHDQELDLIIEAEVRRHGGENRRYAGEDGCASQEGKFARLYRLEHRGGLEVAEGRLGTWTDDGPSA